ncbi:uncharacterized protein NECHADRAFT_79935 [Fusarium vanettenii 77-13-4]|uniref:Uncharacterized protein n=1 Tax=Fusarium vanettenii (strain ATCC MYA-4622 / CBS 123669 / FGSC 9596 / NRRL 45880 / 77-13-4) TaxID=660122 RepID=C7Z0L5_FUSV7|nr:uncharacterized protein NECHADRAFT_79935 [Fusarium vanettenii 77-13-4]EEU42404.1 predicted protein [Fusarium vanettenii 77-13-4]
MPEPFQGVPEDISVDRTPSDALYQLIHPECIIHKAVTVKSLSRCSRVRPEDILLQVTPQVEPLRSAARPLPSLIAVRESPTVPKNPSILLEADEIGIAPQNHSSRLVTESPELLDHELRFDWVDGEGVVWPGGDEATSDDDLFDEWASRMVRHGDSEGDSEDEVSVLVDCQAEVPNLLPELVGKVVERHGARVL